jgi:hypothetical protein
MEKYEKIIDQIYIMDAATARTTLLLLSLQPKWVNRITAFTYCRYDYEALAIIAKDNNFKAICIDGKDLYKNIPRDYQRVIIIDDGMQQFPNTINRVDVALSRGLPQFAMACNVAAGDKVPFTKIIKKVDKLATQRGCFIEKEDDIDAYNQSITGAGRQMKPFWFEFNKIA